MKVFLQIIGWYGVFAILLAYALVSFSFLLSDSWLYQALNATGAIGIVIETYSKRDYQPALLNAVWTLIALVALGRLFLG